jgi:predicted metalloprotease with PDZ domain
MTGSITAVETTVDQAITSLMPAIAKHDWQALSVFVLDMYRALEPSTAHLIQEREDLAGYHLAQTNHIRPSHVKALVEAIIAHDLLENFKATIAKQQSKSPFAISPRCLDDLTLTPITEVVKPGMHVQYPGAPGDIYTVEAIYGPYFEAGYVNALNGIPVFDWPSYTFTMKRDGEKSHGIINAVAVNQRGELVGEHGHVPEIYPVLGYPVGHQMELF